MKDKLQFPFQYLEKYLLGEMEFDDAIDKTLEEVDKLIEEYINNQSK